MDRDIAEEGRGAIARAEGGAAAQGDLVQFVDDLADKHRFAARVGIAQSQFCRRPGNCKTVLAEGSNRRNDDLDSVQSFFNRLTVADVDRAKTITSQRSEASRVGKENVSRWIFRRS